MHAHVLVGFFPPRQWACMCIHVKQAELGRHAGIFLPSLNHSCQATVPPVFCSSKQQALQLVAQILGLIT